MIRRLAQVGVLLLVIFAGGIYFFNRTVAYDASELAPPPNLSWFPDFGWKQISFFMFGSILSILFAVVVILSFHESTATFTFSGSLGYLWFIFVGVSSIFHFEKIPYYEFFSFYTLFTMNYGVGVIAIYEILKRQRIWGIGFIARASMQVTIEKIKKLLKETQQTKLTPEKIKSIRRNAKALSEEINTYSMAIPTLDIEALIQEEKWDKYNDQMDTHTEAIKAHTRGLELIIQIYDILKTAESIYLKKLDKYIELKERNGLIEVKEASKAIGVDERYIKSLFYDSRRKQNLQGFFLLNETFVVESIFIRKIKMMGKVDFEEIRSNLNITTVETKSIINRLYNSGKIKGTFTEDEKCFITENRLREIIRERL